MQACKRVNLTVSYARYPENDLGNFDGERFTGEWANKFLENYFLKRRDEPQEEVLKHCTFRRFNEEGRLLPNGSWTGSIGSVIARSADVTLRMQNTLIKPGLVEFSETFGSEDLVVGHYIDEKRETSPIINFKAIWNILVPSIGFFLEYLSVFLLSLVFVYLLSLALKKRITFVTGFAFNLFTQAQPFFKQSSAIGLFFTFSLLYLFFVKQILSNNVKTEKVIVNDEPILDTMEKILRSNKELCYPLQEDIDMVLNSDTGPMDQYYEALKTKIHQKHPCCLSEYQTIPSQIAEKDFFMLHGEAFMNFLKLFSPIVRKDIFIGDRPFGHGIIIVFYLSKSINRRAKAEFNRQVTIYFEYGFKFQAFRTFQQLFDKKISGVRSVFRNSLEYVKFYTLISDVKLNDFTFVYIFYIIWALTLLIFALYCHTRRLLCICNRQLYRLMGSIRWVPNKARTRNKIRAI